MTFTETVRGACIFPERIVAQVEPKIWRLTERELPS